MTKKIFQNAVWKEGKYFVAQCLNVDVSSFGKTQTEALDNLEEALGLYFEDKPFNDATDVEAPSIISRQLIHA